jgi:hypothetical protein
LNNLIICPKCNKQFISEEFPSHKCIGTTIKRIIDVYYENFFTVEVDGTQRGVALSADGTLYRIKPSPASERPFKSPKNRTEPSGRLVNL